LVLTVGLALPACVQLSLAGIYALYRNKAEKTAFAVVLSYIEQTRVALLRELSLPSSGLFAHRIILPSDRRNSATAYSP
jgi:hypothetical protein